MAFSRSINRRRAWEHPVKSPKDNVQTDLKDAEIANLKRNVETIQERYRQEFIMLNRRHLHNLAYQRRRLLARYGIVEVDQEIMQEDVRATIVHDLKSQVKGLREAMKDMEDRHATEIEILQSNMNRERQIEEEATVERCEKIISKYRTTANNLNRQIIELEQTLMSERKNMNLTVEQLTAHLKRLKLDNVASVLENGPDHSVDVSKDYDEKDKIEEEKIGYITNNNSRVTKSRRHSRRPSRSAPTSPEILKKTLNQLHEMERIAKKDIQTYETRTEVDTTEEEKHENLQPIEENLNSETTTTTSTDTATIEPVISTKLENETEGKKIIEKEKEATVANGVVVDHEKDLKDHKNEKDVLEEPFVDDEEVEKLTMEKEAAVLEQQLLDQQKLISEKRFESEQKHQELIKEEKRLKKVIEDEAKRENKETPEIASVDDVDTIKNNMENKAKKDNKEKSEKSSVEEVDKSEKDVNKNEISSLPVTSDERALKTEVEHESKLQKVTADTQDEDVQVLKTGVKEKMISQKVTANKQEEESSTVAAATTELTIDKKEIAPVNSTVEQKTTHSGEGGVAKEKEDGNGNEKPSLEPVTSSKFQVGAIVRVTSFNWNGIYVGHIGRVNDGAATYQVSFEDNTVDEAVEEENILEYVEKWEVGDKVVVILDEWEDNFIGEITESNNAIDYKKQRYTIYFDNDDTIEHDVTYHCIIAKIS